MAAARRGGPEFDSSEGFRDFIEYNIDAEALGFHSTFVVEHHFTGYGQVSATLNLLTWLGARTRWLRLGTAVIVLPWHHPVLLAEQAATLDLLSGGRLDFGIGKGYRYNEFAGFCVPMEEADARFDEALDVITKAWTAEEPFSHRGRYWQFDKIVVEPPTAQKPHPPIWMGAGGEHSVRRVAQQGYTATRPIRFAPGCRPVNRGIQGCRRSSRTPLRSDAGRGHPGVFRHGQPSRERAAMERRLQNRMRQLKLATRPDGTVHGGPDRATGDPRMVNEISAMYGTPDDISRRLEKLREAGVVYVLINGGGSGGGARGRESLRRFARRLCRCSPRRQRSGLPSDGARVPVSPPFYFEFQDVGPVQSGCLPLSVRTSGDRLSSDPIPCGPAPRRADHCRWWDFGRALPGAYLRTICPPDDRS